MAEPLSEPAPYDSWVDLGFDLLDAIQALVDTDKDLQDQINALELSTNRLSQEVEFLKRSVRVLVGEE